MYIFLALIFLILLTSVYAGWKGAPWVPTWSKDLDRFLNLANVQKGINFYDLGCGDGRLVEAAARAGARAIGYEISILPFIFAKIRQLLSRKKYAIRYQDLWRVNLKNADVIYFFLMEKIMPRMKKKLQKELKPGTKVISYVWPIPGWKEERIDKKEGKPNLYLYII